MELHSSSENPLDNDLDNELDELVLAITAPFDEGSREGCSEFLGIENAIVNQRQKQCFEYSYFLALGHIVHPPF